MTDPAMPEAHDDPTGKNPAAGFWSGVKAAFGGFGLVRKDGRVLRWTLLATAVYLVLWAIALYLVARYDDRVVNELLWPRGPAWWESTLWEIARGLLYLVFWLAALLVTFVIALPVISPLFAFVSEAAETAYFGTEVSHRSNPAELAIELVRGVVRSAGLAITHVAGSGAIWLIGTAIGLFLPPVGTAITVVVGGAWSALWIAMTGVSWPMENNRTPLPRQLRVLPENFPVLLGFGLIAQVLAWIPFTAPITVVSGTLLACRLHRAGRLELPLRIGSTVVGPVG